MNLRRSILQLVTVLGIFSLTLVSTAQALTISFSDPVGDQKGTIDVIAMVMTFNKNTGHYHIQLTASASHPFAGKFRVNINLYNPDVSTSTARFFMADCTKCNVFDPKVNDSDYNLSSPKTTLTL